MNYNNIKNEKQLVLPGFPENVKENFERITEKEVGLKCAWCNEEFKVNDPMEYLDVYDDPWQEHPDTILVHVNNANEEWNDCKNQILGSSGYDYAYDKCFICNRYIKQRNPSNGWHEFFRDLDGNHCCLSCYEKDLYENGVDEESLRHNKIKGMFFNDGDLESHGFVEVDTFFINSLESTKRYCKLAISLIETGHIVITEYFSMGIGGGEGSVTMWKKSLKKKGE